MRFKQNNPHQIFCLYQYKGGKAALTMIDDIQVIYILFFDYFAMRSLLISAAH